MGHGRRIGGGDVSPDFFLRCRGRSAATCRDHRLVRGGGSAADRHRHDHPEQHCQRHAGADQRVRRRRASRRFRNIDTSSGASRTVSSSDGRGELGGVVDCEAPSARSGSVVGNGPTIQSSRTCPSCSSMHASHTRALVGEQPIDERADTPRIEGAAELLEHALIACPSSAAVPKRSSGAAAMARAQIASSPCGAFGTASASRGYGARLARPRSRRCSGRARAGAAPRLPTT